MTISNVKAMVAKAIMAGLLAGAVVMAAPVKAEAQAFQFGVQEGYPQYGYAHGDHDDDHRREEFRRQEEWARHQDWVSHEDRDRYEDRDRHEDRERHEDWVRAHEYRGYRHDAPYWYR